MNADPYQTKAGLSAIFDNTLGSGVVLDDRTGTYWKLDRAMLSLLCKLAKADPATISALGDAADCNERNAVESLVTIGLVEIGTGGEAIPSPSTMVEPIAPKSMSVYSIKAQDLPSFGSVVEYFALNVWFRIEVALTGWRPIYLRKCQSGRTSKTDEIHLLNTVEEVLACMRIAAVLPGTSKRCIPRALTAYEMCRRRGLAPRLIVGAYVEPFEPHVWVECADQIIDTGRADFSLDRFTPLHLL